VRDVEVFAPFGNPPGENGNFPAAGQKFRTP
jgi:hypothetical protein